MTTVDGAVSLGIGDIDPLDFIHNVVPGICVGVVFDSSLHCVETTTRQPDYCITKISKISRG